MELSLKQTKAIDLLEDDITNELVFGGGAGGGKSILGVYFIIKQCLKYPGTRWVIGRAVLKTLKETTLNSFFFVCQQQGLKPNQHFIFYENKSLVRFSNGSEVLLKDLESYPSDPNFDELGSLEITGAFVDECNQISLKAWNILKSRIRYKLDEYKLVPKMLGSCNPSHEWVYSEFYQPFRNKTLKSSRQFIQSLLKDNKFIDSHYEENLLTLDKPSMERLLLGNWEYSDDPAQMCNIESIYDAFTNDFIKPNINKKVISADLAMMGRDMFVGIFWQGDYCQIIIEKAKSPGPVIESDVVQAMEMYSVPRSKVVADSDGLGAFLGGYLKGIKEFHGGGKPVNPIYDNIKSECAFKLAEKINKREIKINCSSIQRDKIVKELEVLKQKAVDGDITKKGIIKKDIMKQLLGHSPDYLDCLLMGMYFEIVPQQVMVLPEWN